MAAQLYPLLFSEHFLRHRLAQRYHQDLESLRPRAQSSWDALLKRWGKERHVLAQLSEADLEKRWVYPLLDDLWPDSLLSQAQQSGDRPDFTFYKSPQDRDAAGQPGADTFAQAVALGELKSWDTDLDKVKGKESPHGQIRRYIGNLLPQWGLLTNGRLWRLYAQNVRTADKSFVTFDLVEMIEQQEFGTFLRFFFLFEQQAVLSGRLELIQEESNRFVVGVGEALRRQVFTALEAIVNGWAGLDPALAQDEAGRKRLYDSGVIYLYRLLFLLYAESRDLLPLGNATYYREFSLAHLLDMIEEAQPLDTHYPAGTLLADELAELFACLNHGRLEAGIAAYNGGLFRPTGVPGVEAPLVDDAGRRLPNSALGAVLRALAYADGERVDYYDLRVQQLGTIYEGLLEHHLEWVNGRLALVYERGERKVLGGFYTPDEVVAYIVQQTLEPLVKQSPTKHRPVEEIMGLRVLDPAMGSGHFLVGVLEYLAEAAGRAELEAYGYTDSVAPDTTPYKRAIAERCLYGVDLNPLAVELAKLSLWLATADRGKPLSFLDHHFKCGNSLVGAWVRDLGHPPRLKGKRQQQVQAGQMSLFETHLNARLPVMMGEVLKILQQPSDDLDQVRAKDAANQAVEDLRAPFLAVAHAWTAASFGLDVAAAYDHLLNLLPSPDTLLSEPLAQEAGTLARQHTFFHWELTFPDAFYQVVQGGAQRRPDAGFHAVVGNPPYVRSITLKASAPDLWDVYRQRFSTAARREFDVYLCFVEQGYRLLAPDGRLTYILPNKWLTSHVGAGLRELLSREKAVYKVVDWGGFQVFTEATTYTCLLFLRRCPQMQIEVSRLQAAQGAAIPLPGQGGLWESGKIPSTPLDTSPWVFSLGGTADLLARISTLPKLGEIAAIFQGTGTRADPVFVLNKTTTGPHSPLLGCVIDLEPTLIQPALVGRDIAPFWHDTETCLLFPYRLEQGKIRLIPMAELQAQHPKTWAYLNEPAVRKTLEDREGGRFRNREDWYAYGRPQNMHLLALPKIVLPDIARRGTCAVDEVGRYILDTAYGVRVRQGAPYSLWTLAGLLNSRFFAFFLQQTGTKLRGGYFRMKTAYLAPFPVPQIPDHEQQQLETFAKRLTDLSHQRYQLHRATCHRILVDLLPPGGRLNQKLDRWWELDFPSFRTEAKKCGGQDIPVPERAQWEHYLQTQAQEYLRLRGEIVTAAEALDRQVYALYGLTPVEVALIEKETKYRHGEA